MPLTPWTAASTPCTNVTALVHPCGRVRDARFGRMLISARRAVGLLADMSFLRAVMVDLVMLAHTHLLSVHARARTRLACTRAALFESCASLDSRLHGSRLRASRWWRGSTPHAAQTFHLAARALRSCAHVSGPQSYAWARFRSTISVIAGACWVGWTYGRVWRVFTTRCGSRCASEIESMHTFVP